MTTISTALLLCTLAQAPAPPAADRRVQAIAPFVETDVFAILQIDLARADLQGLAARVAGDAPSGFIADVKKNLEWSGALRKAGASEVYFVFSVIDMPGQPFAVIPLVEGADAAAINRLFAGGGNGPRLLGFHASATLHNAVVAGSPAAIERARRAAAAPRPEFAAAFAAAGGDSVAARLLILPSADSRRVLEEMVPTFPAELGGGPMTDLTHGMIWAALDAPGGRAASRRSSGFGRRIKRRQARPRRLERLARNACSSTLAGTLLDLKKLVPGIA